ncbi:MAG: hypothetical protein JF606_24525 [Burkholderiales bacterium]|jgi:RTX toxin RtxA|nr:hypothetical protein [Burkholderiales bacterium]
MAFFGQHLASVNPNFSQKEHHLNTLMFLVFDGGHSTQEVLSTLDAIKSSKDPTFPGSPSVAEFAGGYESIADLSSSGAGKQALQERLDKATELTVDYFAQNVA